MRSIHWKRALSLFFGLLLVTSVTAAAHIADPVALLVKFQGDVKVEKMGAKDAVAGAVGAQLSPGDRVLVANGGEAVVLYKTGRLVKAASTVTIEDVPEGTESSLFSNTVKTLGQVATTDARTQPNRQGMIRPLAGAPVPISPRNSIVILGARPTLTWFSVPNVEDYIVMVQRVGTNPGQPVRYNVGADTTWTLPLSAPPLIPGATYSWTVGGAGIGRPAGQQHFTVASSETLATLEQTLNGLITAGIDPDGDGLFLTALAYRDAGLYYEALRALDQIESQGNGRGRAYHMLRGDVYDALGMISAAENAFSMADAAGQ